METGNNSPRKGFAPIDRDTLDQSTARIEALASRLPRAAVVSLAKEVVTRLAHRSDEIEPSAGHPTDDVIDRLAEALIDPQRDAALSLVEAIRAEGATLSEIYLDYLAMAARRLGEWWENDRVSFVEVAVGAGRIYAIICSVQQHYKTPKANPRRHAVFAAVPGETHTLGVTMAADLCREAGWAVDLLVGRDHDELVDEIRNMRCTIIGLSASSHRALASTIRLIVALRIAVPHSQIVISGRLALDEENLVSIVGADYAATDFETAADALENMLD
ncbi:MAG: cobalamin B12-binding domain-containing protein [Pseudomonadota bacterium]